jgi:mercuric ion transport protein
MRSGGAVGLAAVACAACCIGPIVGVLGGIAALGLASTLLIGAAGVVIAAAATTLAVVVYRRRRATSPPGRPVERQLVAVGRVGAPAPDDEGGGLMGGANR